MLLKKKKTASATVFYSAPTKKEIKKKKGNAISVGCVWVEQQSHDKWGDTERNPGDILWLTAFSQPTQGSNFTLLRGSCTHFSNGGRKRVAEWMAAFDFPRVLPMMGSGFGELTRIIEPQSFLKKRFTRWNDLSGQKKKKKRWTETTSGMLV